MTTILYLVPEHPWPPTSGGRFHAAAIAELLAARHQVSILSGDGREGPPAWREGVERAFRRRSSMRHRLADAVGGIARGQHIVLVRALAAGQAAAFADVLESVGPDIVVLARPYAGRFIDQARTRGAAVVIDADESMAKVAISLLRGPAPLRSRVRGLYDLASAGRMERRDYPVADEIWVTSSKERETFEGIARRRVRVTPNVVEADAHAVFDREVTATAFVGWLAYPPNEAAALEFIRDIVPRVRALGGPQRATVIGRDPGQRLIREADRHDVELTGEVPDTRAAVAAAGLLVAPIRTGGGTRIKLLEAAAIGVPIVATRTAAAGSALVAGRDYANGESADDLARAAVALSRDGEARTRIAAAAWRCVSASHSRSGLDRILAAAVSDLLAKGR